jgi:L-ascorbate metabolism protein UlaG (beta-lactamase superfamily)
VHVLVDVSDPENVTHDHPDHVDADFIGQFRGKKLNTEGTLETGDVKIRGLATVHNEGDTPGTNILFIIDIGDLRIVHFGDIGLAALPADQLAAVGSIDLAITQFDNGHSGVDSRNEKGFQLVDELKPRLVIPTHQTDQSTLKMSRWPCVYTDQRTVTLTRDRLPDTTTVFFIGAYAVGQAKFTGATLVDW